MNRRDDRSPRFGGVSRVTGSLLVLAVAAGVSMSAHAGYRCDSPLALDKAERHACDLAKRGAASELRLFIQRTAAIYGLYFYDYVTAADFDGWRAAHSSNKPLSVATAKTRQIK